MMLSVSQQFSPADLLRKMLTKLRGSEPTTRDVGELFSELKGLLSSMRYLIILDDVWVTDLWNQLKHVLPDVKNGSRVLMTSRFIEVAQSADPVMKPYELEFLNEENSRNLLLKKALPYQNSGEKCPDDLLELADELSKKCKGLPLALIILGGILSKKDPTYTEWRKVLRTMDWHYDGKDCIDILAMSYEDLPYYLKSFFLYLALFPEDYEISARRLIMMWVAEGLMLQQRKTKEEIAEDYLEQLVQRSMVQVSSRHVDGSIKNCRLHDLFRDFAMHQAAKENFVTVFANPQDIKHCDPGLMEYLGPKTRSLFLFDLSYNLFDFFKFRLLRVLEITNTGLYLMCGLGGFDRLIHLKYLAIRNCEDIEMRGCSFGHLKNLETLRNPRLPQEYESRFREIISTDGLMDNYYIEARTFCPNVIA
ncbi:Disease resistance protein (CC-NBS-LRR class) family [Rhynchospora pubera]|uniref:Disease resistance protein (CC-NBS-LRR class) family n=1 Tax=Rhynchospora pubera TaxID=906938 RepID=A0AAV8DR02_9POAL|nr:Disease resistance protein (CC-NBS-LRR class) family [Rhynchospora pubera]